MVEGLGCVVGVTLRVELRVAAILEEIAGQFKYANESTITPARVTPATRPATRFSLTERPLARFGLSETGGGCGVAKVWGN